MVLVNDSRAMQEPLGWLPLEDALEQLLWLLSKLPEIALQLVEGNIIFKRNVCGAWVLPAKAADPTKSGQQTQNLT